ncbi:TetR/AcrR family transcriptional regulator [Leucobacter japonicus]|uniref:TetR/AcrR family transcriptional regulator n=1 Tax=Leucobacter japonicus TaxID=1461259 RepID=UPI0006A7F125|nr:TetR/AcrR family transcriptional regulator [Leucobacter japonicus]
MTHVRRLPSQARSEAKVARMLEVAQRIITTDGAEAATTTRIAAEADVSVGTIYRFFASREGLLNVLVGRELDELDRRLAAADYSLGGADWAERADAGADVMIEFADDPGLAFRTLMYTSTLTGEIAATNREHDLRMAHHLISGLPQRALDAMQPSPLAVMHLYLGILDKGMELAFFRPGHRDDAIIAEMKLAARTFLAQYLDAADRPAR